MPPKRRAPAPPTQTKPKARQSALAKEHNISASTESEIKEAFCLFASPNTVNGEMPSRSLRRALTALGVAPASAAELQDLMEAADPEDEGTIAYRHFVAVAALKVNSRSEENQAEEIQEAFHLFTQMGGATNGHEEKITMGCLRRIAKELKEDVSEDVLKSMLLEANGGSGVGRGVNLQDFEGVMRRAGVFR